MSATPERIDAALTRAEQEERNHQLEEMRKRLDKLGDRLQAYGPPASLTGQRAEGYQLAINRFLADLRRALHSIAEPKTTTEEPPR